MANEFRVKHGLVSEGNISGTTFYGDGSGLTNIPSSGITGLNLSQISGGGVTASVSSSGLTVNSGATFNGDVSGTTFYGSGAGLTGLNIPDGTFNQNIPVSLSNGKSLGRYVNGDTIPSSGMTFENVMRMIAVEPLAPTVSLSSPTTIQYNQTSINNVLNFSYIINSLGGSILSVSLDWRRNNSGTWTGLTTNTGLSTYTHSMTDTANNTQPFNYRYVVTDNLGGVATGTTSITPTAYSAPTIGTFSIGSTSRDLGNINTTISTTITRNSPNALLSSYQIQRSINGGAYSNFGSSTPISGSSVNVSVNDNNDNAILNATSVTYRLLVTDSTQTTTFTSSTISFTHRSFLGYSTNTSLILTEILALGNSTLTNSKVRTIAGITANGGTYTYYVYASSAGDLTSIIQDGAAPVLGAFTKLTDVSGTNSYGANVSYRVYKSNSTNAFVNNSLAFS